MNKLIDVISYILRSYLNLGEMSEIRLNKIIYLADWYHAIHNGRQITNITWYSDMYGPIAFEVKQEVERNPDLFNKTPKINSIGQAYDVFMLKNNNCDFKLDSNEKRSLDYIVNLSATIPWNELVKVVYSTYPMLSTRKWMSLDLINKAKEYNSAK